MEKGVALIVEDILKEAREKADEIIRKAKREANKEIETTHSMIEKEEERELGRAYIEGKKIYEELMSERRMKAKKDMLQRKEEIIGEVFKKAEEKLRAHVSSEEYKEDLTRIAIDACKKIGSSDVIIMGNEQDIEHLQQLKERVVRELSSCGSQAKISLGEPIKVTGGVRVKTADGKIELDETFEGRMKREFEALRVEVARILFE
jgi:V/A-type H+-transporting ATPase subunit E